MAGWSGLPLCGGLDAVRPLHGVSMGAGWYYCNDCDQQKFTVRTGSVMERSHVPLAKWAMAFRLFAASKKGMSSKQVQRMLGVSYKTAWFIGHRIREAMKPAAGAPPLGGKGKVLESDETFVGGKAKNVHRGKPSRSNAPFTPLLSAAAVCCSHIADVTAKTLRSTLEKVADRQSACILITRLRTCPSAKTLLSIGRLRIPLVSTSARMASRIRKPQRASLPS